MRQVGADGVHWGRESGDMGSEGGGGDSEGDGEETVKEETRLPRGRTTSPKTPSRQN